MRRAAGRRGVVLRMVVAALFFIVPGDALLRTGAMDLAAQSRPDSLLIIAQAREAVLRYRDMVRFGDSGAFGSRRRLSPRESAQTAWSLRPDVIHRLDEAARELPGDDWLAGHRIGMRVKHGLLNDALAVAEECGATPWWCAALRGFVLHVADRIPEAETAFDEAFAAMPEEEWCAWLGEQEHILDGELLSEYRRADCDERKALEARIWWVADPLWARPGNDRRTEQYGRLVAMRLHHEILAARDGWCEPRHHRELLREGWPDRWWSAIVASAPRAPGSVHTIRPWSVFSDAASGDESAWDLLDGPPHFERYVPPYGPFHPIEHQTAFFLREDSLLVLAATDTAGHILGRGGPAQAAVVLGTDEHSPMLHLTEDLLGGAMRFRSLVPRDRYVVSVELQAPGRGVGRARFGKDPPEAAPGEVTLSDLLLFRWHDGEEETLDEVFPRMLGASSIPVNLPLGVYWEIYGLGDEAEEMEYSLVVRRLDQGILRRMGVALGIASDRVGRTLRWVESAEPSGGRLERASQMGIAHLPQGTYELEMEARRGESEPVTARRRFRIVERRSPPF